MRIDVYKVTGESSSLRREPRLSLENARAGAEVWLDGIDGFFDQFFESRQVGERLTFVAVPTGWQSDAPRDSASFEALPIVHASIVQVSSSAIDALTRLERVQPLAEWSRTAPLKAEDTMAELPAWLRPDDALVDRVRAERIWVTPHEPWRGVPGPDALYLCSDESGMQRCLAINLSSGSCYLVRV